MKTAKYRLTVLLPNEINYGHTIDEAEKVNAISNAMEVYAKEYADQQTKELREEISEINKRKREDENDFVKAINQADDNNRLLREEIEKCSKLNFSLSYKCNCQNEEIWQLKEEIEMLKERNGKYTEEDMGLLWQYIVDKAKQIVIGAEITNNLNFDDYINKLNSNPKS